MWKFLIMTGVKDLKVKNFFYVIAVLIAMVFFIIDKGILSRER